MKFGEVRRSRSEGLLQVLEELAPQVGLEPTTLRLTVENSPRSALLRIALYYLLSVSYRRRQFSEKCGDYPQFRTFLKEYTHTSPHRDFVI